MGRIRYIRVCQDFVFHCEYTFAPLGLGRNNWSWFLDYFESGGGLGYGRIINQVVVVVFVAVSLTSPHMFFRWSLRRFELGVPCLRSASCSCITSSLLVSQSSCGSCMMGWEGCGSSSHFAVANSANRCFIERGRVGLLGCGAGRLRGGNSIVR